MKKIFLVSLCIILAFSLFSCKGTKAPEELFFSYDQESAFAQALSQTYGFNPDILLQSDKPLRFGMDLKLDKFETAGGQLGFDLAGASVGYDITASGDSASGKMYFNMGSIELEAGMRYVDDGYYINLDPSADEWIDMTEMFSAGTSEANTEEMEAALSNLQDLQKVLDLVIAELSNEMNEKQKLVLSEETVSYGGISRDGTAVSVTLNGPEMKSAIVRVLGALKASDEAYSFWKSTSDAELTKEDYEKGLDEYIEQINDSEQPTESDKITFTRVFAGNEQISMRLEFDIDGRAADIELITLTDGQNVSAQLDVTLSEDGYDALSIDGSYRMSEGATEGELEISVPGSEKIEFSFEGTTKVDGNKYTTDMEFSFGAGGVSFKIPVKIVSESDNKGQKLSVTVDFSLPGTVDITATASFSVSEAENYEPVTKPENLLSEEEAQKAFEEFFGGIGLPGFPTDSTYPTYPDVDYDGTLF